MYFAVEGEPPFDNGGPIPTSPPSWGMSRGPSAGPEPSGPIIAALLSKDLEARPSEKDLIGMLEEMASAGVSARMVG